VPRGERPVYCSNCYNRIKPPAPRSDEREGDRLRAPRLVR
jgi:hypothetical protein